MAWWPAPGHAQGVRGWAGTHLRYVEVRPFVTDTFPFEEAVIGPGGEFTVDGLPVSCLPDLFCTALVPTSMEHAVVASHEVGFTAWGFGVTGLSATGLILARDKLSGDFVWPRSDDPLDLALGYLEWTRSGLRMRLGRQNVASGLGFASFDGLETTVLVTPTIRVQAFGGRSLARGLLEPRNEALRGVEDFIPDDQAYLIGGSLRMSPEASTQVEVRYQREAWTGGHHLISERASLDLRTRRFSPVSLTASVDYDFGFGRVGKANLLAEYAVSNSFDLRARLRRYLPYFELSTIWGFFSPVAYHEGDLEFLWSARPGLQLWGGAAWRKYEDAEVTVVRRPLEDDALQVRSGVRTRLGTAGSLSAGYRLELGAGSYLQGADLNVTWDVTPRVSVEARSSLFQQIGEFRLGNAMVVGGGVIARARLASRWGIEAGATRYRNVDREREDDRFDGSHDRVWTSIRVDLGFGGAGS